MTRLHVGSAGKIIIKQEKVFFFLGRGLLVRVGGFVIQLIKKWWPNEWAQLTWDKMNCEFL